MYVRRTAWRGMSLMDIIVGTALALLIFMAIFGLLRASAQISTLAAQTAAATAIASSQMEYIRSLPYSSVGTIGGIPSGAIPQEATTTEDGIEYGVRTFIGYYDDPADGTGGSDATGVTADYKRAKVTVTFFPSTGMKQVSVVSNVAPPGVESTTGGGTIRVNVVNSAGAPLAGADVHVVNPSISPAVNLTTFSDATGAVLLPGAATSTNYQITVTKTNYSTAQTYDRTTANPNPAPGHLTVVANSTTSGTFAIDLLASLILTTLNPIASGSWSDTFADGSKLGKLSGTAVSGGALQLANGGVSGYAPSGSAESAAISVPSLASWTTVTGNISAGGGQSVRVRVADASGALIPDAALAGNGAGFASFPIDLSGLATTTYPELMLKADLTTSATTSTPSLNDWTVGYRSGPTPVPNVSYTVSGTKTIGSSATGVPIYKNVIATTTDSTGNRSLFLEWDSYTLAVSGQNPLNVCGSMNVLPGASITDGAYVGTAAANSLVVAAENASGVRLANAIVTVSRSGFSERVATNSCGVAYFGGLESASDYAVSAASGPLSGSASGISVSGATTYGITLN